MEKVPFPLWACFLSYKMKMVIPALECECEGGLCGPGGHRGWESILPALGQGQEVGRLREGLGQEQGCGLRSGESEGVGQGLLSRRVG